MGKSSELPELKLGIAAMGLLPALAEPNLGGLTAAFCPELPDLKLGTAALGLPPTPAESGLGGLGFLSELPDLKLGTAALGLPPTPTESSFGGLIAGLFHELPELEYGDPTEPLLDVVGHAEVDWPVTPYQESRTSASL